ncbi:hypothetical protein [Hymenobacter sp.]|uniref:hypothetical protein n=1 Tax=Hymenobacter sp. TaxID=1898978 RepID=UPI0039C8BCC9
MLEWVEQKGLIEKFVIIDDDLSINNLPISIKGKWVSTKPMIGIDDEATEKALAILLGIKRN